MITIIHRIESLNILAFHFSDSFTIKKVNISPSDLLILSYCFSHFLAASLNCCLMYGPTSVLCRIITNARIIKATSGWQATQKRTTSPGCGSRLQGFQSGMRSGTDGKWVDLGGGVAQWCEHVTNGNGTPNHRRNEMFAGRQCSEFQMRGGFSGSGFFQFPYSIRFQIGNPPNE